MPYETYTKWSLEEARRLARALNLRTNKALWGLVAFAFLFFFVSSILYERFSVFRSRHDVPGFIHAGNGIYHHGPEGEGDL